MSLKDIIGKWPGDETDEEIAAALKEIDGDAAFNRLHERISILDQKDAEIASLKAQLAAAGVIDRQLRKLVWEWCKDSINGVDRSLFVGDARDAVLDVLGQQPLAAEYAAALIKSQGKARDYERLTRKEHGMACPRLTPHAGPCGICDHNDKLETGALRAEMERNAERSGWLEDAIDFLIGALEGFRLGHSLRCVNSRHDVPACQCGAALNNATIDSAIERARKMRTGAK